MGLFGYFGRHLHGFLQGLSAAQEIRAALALRASTRLQAEVSTGGRERQLLVDVSTLANIDAKTGIQRVARAILVEWLRHPPAGFTVRPVQASRWQPFHYADAQKWLGDIQAVGPQGEVQANAGDIFLSLDLTAHILPLHHRQLARWKLSGVKIFFVVYDLLPTLRPDWFTDAGVKAQRRWLRTLAIHADGAACISHTVAGQLREWLDSSLGPLSPPLAIEAFSLGADINQNTDEVTQLPSALRIDRDQQTVLMVGTIEPRKGHAVTLSAFERVWNSGSNAHLVIVGKVGWKVDRLVERLRNHPENGKRLHWIENGDDALLHALYQHCSGLLMASEGEGFGLPIVEAARYGLPVLVRDLPVFREIAGDAASYFTADTPDALAGALSTWLSQLANATAVSSKSMRVRTWEESAKSLLDAIGIAH